MSTASEPPRSITQTDNYRAQLAAIVESSQDAIIGIDLAGSIISWNSGAEIIFGYTAAEMIGTSVGRLNPEDRVEEERYANVKFELGERVANFETLRKSKSGRLIDVSIAASPIRDSDGRVYGVSKILRDITVLKDRERELARMSRLYAALSHVNLAILRATTREELFQNICTVLVEQGGLQLVWIGALDPGFHRLSPVAYFGDDKGYLQKISVQIDDHPLGRGPSGTAFRTGQPQICHDIPSDPSTLPWQAELKRCGFHSIAAFPIRVQGKVTFILHVYADRRDFFQNKEISLLEEAANAVSFALDNFARDVARRQAEQTVHSEKSFSDTMVESMPGIVYFYDEKKRFLRWNKNFERVSGYEGDEIARMSPLDFFSNENQPLIQAGITEALTQGESCVEAPFRTKDGRQIPYYFTGRRVVFNSTTSLVGVGVDISERKSAEASLRQSLERFTNVARATNDAVWDWNLVTNAIWWNESFQTLFCYEPNEIEAGIESWTLRLHPKDKERVLTGIHAVLDSGGKVWTDEYRFRRRDGSFADVLDRGYVLRNDAGCAVRMVGAILDITERKQSEAKIRESEARYRRIFERASYGIVIADVNGYYVDANPSLCRMLGFKREELIGLHSYEVVIPAEIQHIAPALKAIKSEEEYLREWRFKRKDGTAFDAEVIATTMPDGNLMGMIRDISERKLAEAEREKRFQAEAADRVKSAFLATMSHELRTPLNSIIGFSGVVLNGLAGPLNPEQTKQLGMVRSSARHLLALVNDILDISKIEAGQLTVSKERFDLRRSIEKVIALITPMAEAKNLNLIAQLPEELGAAVSDERRFEQILLNLLSNAIKFTDYGKIVLAAEIIENFEPAGALLKQPAIRVRVIDNGMGIKPEDLPALFQPFRQIDSGLSRNHEGTGLGLAICHRLANLMGGEVQVESKWGSGSTFTVTLPTGIDR